jgi:hypothetical protein
MASINDVRAAGYEVQLSLKGWGEGEYAVRDVYVICRVASQCDRRNPE